MQKMVIQQCPIQIAGFLNPIKFEITGNKDHNMNE